MDGEQETEKKEKDGVTRAEKQKLNAGERELEMAMGGHGRGGFSSITESDDESNVNDGPPVRLKRRRFQLQGIPRIEDGVTAFGSLMRKAELANF